MSKKRTNEMPLVSMRLVTTLRTSPKGSKKARSSSSLVDGARPRTNRVRVGFAGAAGRIQTKPLFFAFAKIAKKEKILK